MMANECKAGDRVRYIGSALEPGYGATGILTWGRDTDFYDGHDRGPALVFIRDDDNGYFVEPEEVEKI